MADLPIESPGPSEAGLAVALREAAKINPQLKTSSYTAVSGETLIADTTGGSWPLTLPSSPSAGAAVRIIGHGWDVNNLTIARNGQTIDGAAENLTCDYDADLLMIFIGGTWTY